jgi:hypothetical protein
MSGFLKLIAAIHALFILGCDQRSVESAVQNEVCYLSLEMLTDSRRTDVCKEIWTTGFLCESILRSESDRENTYIIASGKGSEDGCFLADVLLENVRTNPANSPETIVDVKAFKQAQTGLIGLDRFTRLESLALQPMRYTGNVVTTEGYLCANPHVSELPPLLLAQKDDCKFGAYTNGVQLKGNISMGNDKTDRVRIKGLFYVGPLEALYIDINRLTGPNEIAPE